ncbi:hypothetical protein A2164_03435 [Candidatus Curtissbacteria bacterium RBG_13_35_7]|uniref:Uncharacterized protein n=1 Tax=Candidatus Curtissbacteria bacterium RBG_13_35_7 TaxID=1797705 RepID=A0A1F5G4J0_9BACT|nr:MAG: hypothetical protein A2164_03435 [Candidatus Curtissbacteria bacterium RBG_13_35_7]
MPIEESGFRILDKFSAAFGIESFLILFLIFFTVFAIILYRQIQVMTKKLPTPLTPFLRFVAILLIGVSMAVLFLIIGNF